MTVEHRRIEGTALGRRRVVGVERFECLLLVDLQLIDQAFKRVRAERLARRVTRLQQIEHLAVEDLVGEALRLLQDHAAVFGVGIRIEVSALIDPAVAFDVEHDALRVGKPVGLVGHVAAAVVGCGGNDRRRMTAAPVAPRHGANVERHLQAVTVVEVRAAHLGVVPRLAEVTQAPFRIGFKTTATEDHRLRSERLQAFRRAHHHTADAAAFVLREADHRVVITNIDADLFAGLEPGLRQADTFMHGANDGADRPFDLALDLDAHDRLREFELVAAGVLQPAHRIPRFFDQNFRQHRVGAAFGHAHQVFAEKLGGVRFDAGVKARIFLLDVGHETGDIAGFVEDVAENCAGKMRVAAALFLRRLFKQHDFFRAGFTRRHRGRKRGIAATYNDYIETAHRQPP